MTSAFRTWSPIHSTAIERLRVFALHGTDALGKKIAHSLGCDLGAIEERSFEDGEHKIRPLETVAGCDVYVVHSLGNVEQGFGNIAPACPDFDPLRAKAASVGFCGSSV
jgi:ribose-phosphate pyrophosphokinase